MSIKSRIKDINSVVRNPLTREVYRRDKTHFAYHVQSAHNPDVPYQVIVTWTKQAGILTATTFLYSYEPQYEDGNHPANNNGTICYQVLGALKKAALADGKSLHVRAKLSNAKIYQKIYGGQLVAIKNDAGTTVWGIVK